MRLRDPPACILLLDHGAPKSSPYLAAYQLEPASLDFGIFGFFSRTPSRDLMLPHETVLTAQSHACGIMQDPRP